MSKWYNSQGNNSDVVLSSKIRLARNLADAPFPCRLGEDGRKSVDKKIFASIKNSKLAGEFEMQDLDNLTDIERIAMAEKGIISPEFAKQREHSSVMVSREENLSIMLCEEDHIRITSMVAGQNLEQAYSNADEVDDIFINSLNIAFDERLGFLTSNPMNLGTGLKASLVLHLPAIYERGMLSSLSNMVSKLGFSIKPLFGNTSAIFELSNRISLGITEKNAIDNLNAICEQIVKQERALREELIKYDDFEDKIFRAMGTLKMARKLSTKEFYSLISLARLGVAMGKFDISYEKIGTMLYTLGTASVMSKCDSDVTLDEADRLRAQYIRETLQ